MKPRTRVGVTLIEVLVVITIIGILAALLLPAVMMAREAARRLVCSSNLKQIGLAMQTYHTSYNCFPPGRITAGLWQHSRNGICWPIALLPYIEQQNLYDAYDSRYPNEDPKNEQVRIAVVETYMCPTDGNARRVEAPLAGPGNRTNYRGGSYRGMGGRVDGIGGWWDCFDGYTTPESWIGVLHVVGSGRRGPENIGRIRDGTSTTLMVGEYHTRTQTRQGTFWAYAFAHYNSSDASPAPRTLLPDYDACVAAGAGPGGEHACKRGWGSFHPGGLNFLFCDGSVHFLAETIDMETFGQLATIHGQELAKFP